MPTDSSKRRYYTPELRIPMDPGSRSAGIRAPIPPHPGRDRSEATSSWLGCQSTFGSLVSMPFFLRIDPPVSTTT